MAIWRTISSVYSLSIFFQSTLILSLSIKEVCSFQYKRINTPLSGRNLMIIPINAPVQFRFNNSTRLEEHMPRAAKVQISIVDWMSCRYNFTWEIITTNETTLEKPISSGYKGSMSYLLDGSCDLVVGNILMTQNRYKLIDMPYPWAQTQTLLLTSKSKSDSQANFKAVLKPFDIYIWFLIVTSISVVGIILLLFTRNTSDHQPVDSPSTIYFYVIGILLSQGGHCKWKRNVIRLIVGIWCLACFVLIQAYNSTLITYVIAPNNQPFINSIEDVAKRREINILLEKNKGLDTVFLSNTDEKGLFRMIRDKLDAYPNSRCDLESQCIDLMLSDVGHFVYLKSKSYFMELMLDDFEKTGQCRFQIVKEGFMNIIISFALKKHSPYTASFTEGVIEMHAFGLINYWNKLNIANPYHCLDQQSKKKSSGNPRLSLKNLSAAFVVLLVGYVTSFIVFIIERVIFSWRCLRYNTST